MNLELPSRPDVAPPGPIASEVARIDGVGLTQVIVTGLNPLEYSVFLNERPMPREEMDALVVSIDSSEQDLASGPVRATISHRVKTFSGETTKQQLELFPGTVTVVALGRRISVTCPDPTRLDGVWIGLGLKLDGTSREISGVRALNLVLNNDLLSASVLWNDGTTEDLLPQ